MCSLKFSWVFCSFDNLRSVRGDELILGEITHCVYDVYAALMAALGSARKEHAVDAIAYLNREVSASRAVERGL